MTNILRVYRRVRDQWNHRQRAHNLEEAGKVFTQNPRAVDAYIIGQRALIEALQQRQKKE